MKTFDSNYFPYIMDIKLLNFNVTRINKAPSFPNSLFSERDSIKICG